MFLSFLFSWFVIEVLTSQNVGSGVTGVAFHPTKNLVASCSYDKSVKLWNADSGAELWTVKVDGDVDSIDFAPCGNKFAIACNNYNSSSYSVQIFSQEGSTGNFACQSTLNVGYAFSRCSTRISLARPLFSRFSTRISV